MKKTHTIHVFLTRWLLAGAMLAISCCGSAWGQTITNGSFETDILSRLGSNGYIIGPNVTANTTWPVVIPGWTYTSGDTPAHGYGLSDKTNRPTFSANSIIPDGNWVAFLQSNGSLTTTISDLIVGEKYVLGYYYNARVSSGTAEIKTELGGVVFQPQTLTRGIQTEYHYFEQAFVASATSMDFVVHSFANDDRTLLLDNVTVREWTQPVGWQVKQSWTSDADSGIVEGAKYTHALNFNGKSEATINGVVFQNLASGKDIPSSSLVREAGPWAAGDMNHLFPGNSNSFALGTTFLHAFNNDQTDHVVLTGLLPGMQYEMTIFTNSFGSENRWASLTANGDSHVYNSFAFTPLAPNYEGGTFTWIGDAVVDNTTAPIYNLGGKIALTIKNLNNNIHISGVAARALPTADVIMGTAFSGLNGADYGKAVVSNTLRMDYANIFEGKGNYNDTWQVRGSVRGNNLITVVGNLQLGANSGLAMEFDAGALAGNLVNVSVDVLMGSNFRMNNEDYFARGIGVGFFDDEFGSGGSDFVSRGFSGIVIRNDGSVVFYNNPTGGDNPDEIYVSDAVNWGGTTGFVQNEWYNLAMQFAILDDETAILTGLSIGDAPEGYYSALYGKAFSSLDLIGFSSSGSDGFNYFDNLIVLNGGGAAGATPEPATWVLMAIGLMELAATRRWRARGEAA